MSDLPPDQRQSVQYLSIKTDAGDAAFQITALHGEERISEPFLYAVELYADDSSVDYASLIGTNGIVTIHVTEDDKRYIHGVFREFALTGIWYEQKRLFFRAVLVPKLALLDLEADCRIFQNKSVTDIVYALLDEGGVTDRTPKLSGTYTAREYCVQYRETTLNFIRRLFEDEGIFFFFEHSDSAHTMIIGDDTDAHADCPVQSTLTWSDVGTGGYASITDCRLEHRITSNAVGMSSYHFETPATDLYVKQTGAASNYLMNDWGLTHTTSSDGERLAKIRLGAHELQATLFRASGWFTSMVCGGNVTIASHPRSEMNVKWTLLAVEISATPEAFVAELTGFPATATFRAPRQAHRSRIASTQMALVVGASGDEILTDKYGRVKVQFYWDRVGTKDDKSSCFIRVAQAWAGASWGSIFIPRVGMEVVVSFIDGDPDHPLITGCVYNATNSVPYTLPDNKTQSTIKSLTSTQGTGKNNEMRFEDKSGSEEFYVHAQKDLNLTVENDETRTIKHDHTSTITNDCTVTINHDNTITVKNDRSRTVSEGNESLTVSKGTRTVEVKGDETHTSHGKFTHTVDGDYALTVKGKMSITVTGALEITADSITMTSKTGDIEMSSAANVKATAKADITATATGNVNAKATASMSLEGTAGATLKTGASLTCQGSMATFKADGMGELSAGGILTVKGSLVKIN
jgi:type VI secretion system secreted protein VgrG